MEKTNRSFQVLVRHKVPFVSDLLFKLNLICAFILLIIFLFFLPAETAPTEIHVGSFKWVVPSFIKKILLVALIGLMISLLLWLRIGSYKNAVLAFLPEAITINGKNLLFNLPVTRIIKITVDDPVDRDGKRKGAFKFIIDLPSEKIWIRLKDEKEVDEFLDQLGTVKVEGYDKVPYPA